MQTLVHRFTSLLLALALVLTGPGLAGPAKGAMLVELCADGAQKLIWLDAEGNPIQPGKVHTKCLDCLLFSATLPEPAGLRFLPAPLRVSAGLSLPVPPEPRPIAHLRPIPRGPPAAKGEDWRPADPRPDTRSLPWLALVGLDSHQAKPLAAVTKLRAIPESAPA